MPSLNRREAMLSLAALAGPAASAARAQAGLPALRQRLVLAHWHVFTVSPDNLPPERDAYARDYLNPDGFGGRYRHVGGYMRERPLPRPPRNAVRWPVEDMAEDIMLAAAIGIDAFLFNIVDLPPGPNWPKISHALQACLETRSPLRIMPSLDCAAGLMEQDPDRVASAIATLARHPAIMRTADGRMMLSAFYPERYTALAWRRFLGQLAALGVPVSFTGILLSFRRTPDDLLRLMERVAEWGVATESALPAVAGHATRARQLGLGWGMPVWPQDFRPKDGWFAESRNSAVFRASWQQAMASDADFVHIVTWNDYSEGSEIRPSTGIQHGFYDLAAYYARWYRSGHAPPVTQDVLYYVHRVQAAAQPPAGLRQGARFHLKFGERPIDEIELIAFLKAPGEIAIEIGGHVTRRAAPAGITVLRAPLRPGQPVFWLTREGREIVRTASPFPVMATAEYQDLLYRAGSSARPPLQLALGSPAR